MEKVQGFFEKNLIWIMTLVFSLGVNYAAVTLRLEAKVSKDDVRYLIQEELKSKSYTLIDGKLMEMRMSNLESKMSEMNSGINKLLQYSQYKEKAK